MENQILKTVSKWLLIVMLIFSLLGFFDATYLAVKYYQGLAIGCLGLGNCEKVTTSQYATIGGVPLSLIGAIYYLFIFILIGTYFLTLKNSIIDFAARFTIVGFLISLLLVYLQLFVIQAICIYCMISAFTSTILFAFGSLIIKFQKVESLS